MWRGGRRLAIAFGSGVVALTATAVLHLPVARPLLARLEFLCPVNRVSPDVVERLQARAVKDMSGSTPTPSHAAFGLRLLSGASDVTTWVDGQRLDCEATTRGFTYLSCRHVPAAALERAAVEDVRDREVVVARSRAGKVVAVDVLARADAGRDAAALANATISEVRASLGAPHRVVGSFDATSLGKPFGSAALRYEYSDAVVIVSATNIPGSGVAVREQYLAAN